MTDWKSSQNVYTFTSIFLENAADMWDSPMKNYEKHPSIKKLAKALGFLPDANTDAASKTNPNINPIPSTDTISTDNSVPSDTNVPFCKSVPISKTVSKPKTHPKAPKVTTRLLQKILTEQVSGPAIMTIEPLPCSCAPKLNVPDSPEPKLDGPSSCGPIENVEEYVANILRSYKRCTFNKVRHRVCMRIAGKRMRPFPSWMINLCEKVGLLRTIVENLVKLVKVTKDEQNTNNLIKVFRRHLEERFRTTPSGLRQEEIMIDNTVFEVLLLRMGGETAIPDIWDSHLQYSVLVHGIKGDTHLTESWPFWSKIDEMLVSYKWESFKVIPETISSNMESRLRLLILLKPPLEWSSSRYNRRTWLQVTAQYINRWPNSSHYASVTLLQRRWLELQRGARGALLKGGGGVVGRGGADARLVKVYCMMVKSNPKLLTEPLPTWEQLVKSGAIFSNTDPKMVEIVDEGDDDVQMIETIPETIDCTIDSETDEESPLVIDERIVKKEKNDTKDNVDEIDNIESDVENVVCDEDMVVDFDIKEDISTKDIGKIIEGDNTADLVEKGNVTSEVLDENASMDTDSSNIEEVLNKLDPNKTKSRIIFESDSDNESAITDDNDAVDRQDIDDNNVGTLEGLKKETVDNTIENIAQTDLNNSDIINNFANKTNNIEVANNINTVDITEGSKVNSSNLHSKETQIENVVEKETTSVKSNVSSKCKSRRSSGFYRSFMNGNALRKDPWGYMYVLQQISVNRKRKRDVIEETESKEELVEDRGRITDTEIGEEKERVVPDSEIDEVKEDITIIVDDCVKRVRRDEEGDGDIDLESFCRPLSVRLERLQLPIEIVPRAVRLPDACSVPARRTRRTAAVRPTRRGAESPVNNTEKPTTEIERDDNIDSSEKEQDKCVSPRQVKLLLENYMEYANQCDTEIIDTEESLNSKYVREDLLSMKLTELLQKKSVRRKLADKRRETVAKDLDYAEWMRQRKINDAFFTLPNFKRRPSDKNNVTRTINDPNNRKANANATSDTNNAMTTLIDPNISKLAGSKEQNNAAVVIVNANNSNTKDVDSKAAQNNVVATNYVISVQLMEENENSKCQKTKPLPRAIERYLAAKRNETLMLKKKLQLEQVNRKVNNYIDDPKPADEKKANIEVEKPNKNLSEENNKICVNKVTSNSKIVDEMTKSAVDKMFDSKILRQRKQAQKFEGFHLVSNDQNKRNDVTQIKTNVALDKAEVTKDKTENAIESKNNRKKEKKTVDGYREWERQKMVNFSHFRLPHLKPVPKKPRIVKMKMNKSSLNTSDEITPTTSIETNSNKELISNIESKNIESNAKFTIAPNLALSTEKSRAVCEASKQDSLSDTNISTKYQLEILPISPSKGTKAHPVVTMTTEEYNAVNVDRIVNESNIVQYTNNDKTGNTLSTTIQVVLPQKEQDNNIVQTSTTEQANISQAAQESNIEIVKLQIDNVDNDKVTNNIEKDQPETEAVNENTQNAEVVDLTDEANEANTSIGQLTEQNLRNHDQRLSRRERCIKTKNYILKKLIKNAKQYKIKVSNVRTDKTLLGKDNDEAIVIDSDSSSNSDSEDVARKVKCKATVNSNKETVNPNIATVNPNKETVNHNKATVNSNIATVNPFKETVNDNKAKVNHDAKAVLFNDVSKLRAVVVNNKLPVNAVVTVPPIKVVPKANKDYVKVMQYVTSQLNQNRFMYNQNNEANIEIRPDLNDTSAKNVTAINVTSSNVITCNVTTGNVTNINVTPQLENASTKYSVDYIERIYPEKNPYTSVAHKVLLAKLSYNETHNNVQIQNISNTSAQNAINISNLHNNVIQNVCPIAPLVQELQSNNITICQNSETSQIITNLNNISTVEVLQPTNIYNSAESTIHNDITHNVNKYNNFAIQNLTVCQNDLNNEIIPNVIHTDFTIQNAPKLLLNAGIINQGQMLINNNQNLANIANDSSISGLTNGYVITSISNDNKHFLSTNEPQNAVVKKPPWIRDTTQQFGTSANIGDVINMNNHQNYRCMEIRPVAIGQPSVGNLIPFDQSIKVRPNTNTVLSQPVSINSDPQSVVPIPIHPETSVIRPDVKKTIQSVKSLKPLGADIQNCTGKDNLRSKGVQSDVKDSVGRLKVAQTGSKAAQSEFKTALSRLESHRSKEMRHDMSAGSAVDYDGCPQAVSLLPEDYKPLTNLQTAMLKRISDCPSIKASLFLNKLSKNQPLILIRVDASKAPLDFLNTWVVTAAPIRVEKPTYWSTFHPLRMVEMVVNEGLNLVTFKGKLYRKAAERREVYAEVLTAIASTQQCRELILSHAPVYLFDRVQYRLANFANCTSRRRPALPVLEGDGRDVVVAGFKEMLDLQ